MAECLISLMEITELPKELFPATVKWVEDIKPLNSFHLWLENCVSDQNCNTAKELRTVRVLKESEKLPEEDTLIEKYNDYFPGDANVYPYQQDLSILENVKREEEQRMTHLADYLRVVNALCNEMTISKVESKADEMLASEVRKINAAISGDYRHSLNMIVSSFTNLDCKLRHVSNNEPSLGLVCITPLDSFCKKLEYLSSFVLNLIKHYEQTIEVQNNKRRKELVDTNDFSSHEFTAINLRRVFNDCVTIAVNKVLIESEIQGITASLNALDDANLMENNFHSQRGCVNRDEISDICFQRTRKHFCKTQTVLNQVKFPRRKKNLKKFTEIAEIAKPLKLCGDAIVHIIKNEYKWIRMACGILSDCHEAMEDIHTRILTSHKQINNMKTMHELSFGVTSDSGISSTFLRFFDSQADALNETSEDGRSLTSITGLHSNSTFHSTSHSTFKLGSGHIESIFNMLQTISEDYKTTMAGAKTLHGFLFKGPTATPCLDLDLKSSIIRSKKALCLKKEKLKKIDYSFYELKVSHHTNLLNKLMDQLWYIYYTDPLKMDQLVNRAEEEAKIYQRHHILSAEERKNDFLEEFFE